MAERIGPKQRAARVFETVSAMFPQAQCELRHQNDYELLCAIALSAQTTDDAVNRVTPALFTAFPSIAALANASASDVETHIRTIGLYRNKAKHLIAMAKMVEEEYGGTIPVNQADLERLPGVGHKTANVFLAVWHHVPRIAVDTHVERVAKRLGLASEQATVRDVEESLKKRFAEADWIDLHHRLLFFGRYHCTAKAPTCGACPLLDICKKPLL
jgi:endonuclease-3